MLNDDLKIKTLQRGTRLITGETAFLKRQLIDSLVDIAVEHDFVEIELPSIEPRSLYDDKVGGEIVDKQMYTFKDKGDRDICLRPEGTATCQLIAQQYRFDNNIKLFYVTRCWRYERPQEGRYREFTQFGVEILNPTQDFSEYLQYLSVQMIEAAGDLDNSDYTLNLGVKRGLSYYNDGVGWEVEVDSLGSQKQVLGGGSYPEGIGFALGVDRLVLATQKKYNNRNTNVER
jgi:histidyl-tRNA synthetase